MRKCLGMPALIRPFSKASPYRACASPGHLLPKGEGHARGFSLVNVLNSYRSINSSSAFIIGRRRGSLADWESLVVGKNRQTI